MALTEETKIDKIEIVGEFKSVQVREANIISKDGVEVAQSYHRRVIQPTDDISNEPEDIKSLCGIYHTEEVKSAYEAQTATVSL